MKEIISKFKSEECLKLLLISSSEGKLKVRYEEQLQKLRVEYEKKVKRELAKIDKFYKIIATTDKTYREAETEVYHNEDFYQAHERKLAEEEEKKKPIVYYPDKEKKPKKLIVRKEFALNFYMEKKLNSKDMDTLLNQKFKRLKISPYGDTGAAYYWVKTRYNEGKEHAFFCYLVESELKKHIKKVRLNVNNGPDVEFEYKKKKYCFDIETGKKLERSKVSVDWKYSKYQKEYDEIFILVTRKSLKYKYTKYGQVITRGKLKETISSIFI